MSSNHIHRTLTPATAGTSTNVSAGTPWTTFSAVDGTTALQLDDAPQGMVVTMGADNNPRLWVLSNAAGHSRLESFTDILVSASPAMTGPAERFELQVNPATGETNNLVLQWSAVAGTPATSTYRLQIALDSAFTQIVADLAPINQNMAIIGPNAGLIGTGIPATLTDPAVPAPSGFFPFQAGTPYYWRVRVESPIPSTFSAARSFVTGSLRPLTLQAPANGADRVSVRPTFVWTPVTGATTYELVVSDDPTFAIITFSRTTSQPVFASDEQLAFDTVYYWRVRASAPPTAVTPFATGIFTTEERPVTATTTPGQTQPTVTTTQTTFTVTVPPGDQVEVIPPWMLWLIIGIGAILVIALLVLIIRTRRSS
jgi:hypothetical protein